MKAWLSALWNLVGNNKAMRWLIYAFVAIVLLLAFRCSVAQPQVWVNPGASFGGGYPTGATLSLTLRLPLASEMYLDFGPTLWGSRGDVHNNWDYHARLTLSKIMPVGELGAGIGIAYLQNTDALDGSHANFALLLFFRPFHRLSLDVIHVSNAGTDSPNTGRQAVGPSLRLR